MILENAMDKFAEAIAQIKDPEKQEEATKLFEVEIDKAFEEAEKQAEDIFQKENAELEAQKKADADALAEQEKVDEERLAGGDIISDAKALSATTFAKKYPVKEIRSLADKLGLDSSGRDLHVVKRIQEDLDDNPSGLRQK